MKLQVEFPVEKGKRLEAQTALAELIEMAHEYASEQHPGAKVNHRLRLEQRAQAFWEACGRPPRPIS